MKSSNSITTIFTMLCLLAIIAITVVSCEVKEGKKEEGVIKLPTIDTKDHIQLTKAIAVGREVEIIASSKWSTVKMVNNNNVLVIVWAETKQGVITSIAIH